MKCLISLKGHELTHNKPLNRFVAQANINLNHYHISLTQDGGHIEKSILWRPKRDPTYS